jgi:hypothetical protein
VDEEQHQSLILRTSPVSTKTLANTVSSTEEVARIEHRTESENQIESLRIVACSSEYNVLFVHLLTEAPPGALSDACETVVIFYVVFDSTIVPAYAHVPGVISESPQDEEDEEGNIISMPPDYMLCIADSGLSVLFLLAPLITSRLEHYWKLCLVRYTGLDTKPSVVYPQVPEEIGLDCVVSMGIDEALGFIYLLDLDGVLCKISYS